MTPATLREQAATRWADGWATWLDLVFEEGITETPHLTDARDTYYTARDALTAAREDQ